MRGHAVQLQGEQPDLRAAWLKRFPEQRINFELPDFAFWRIVPADARFVAGFGRIHNLFDTHPPLEERIELLREL